MPYYFMRDTPLQVLEQLMMSQPGQKPRGGGIYRSPFRYTPEDVACEYCQNYDRKHSCRLYECTCLEERIEAGVLKLNAFMRDCFTPSMGPQFRKRMHRQFREETSILPIFPVRCPPAKMDTLARALLAFVRAEQSGPLPAHGIREPLAQDGLEMRE
ncbi:MAG: hypothetical protein V8S77_04820 [Oscillospiraceae bacterium]